MKYATYSEYKPSYVDWLGDVPSHWAVKAIKWESPVLRGASPRPIDDPIYFDDDGEYAWVRIADVTEAGTYLEYTEQNLSDIGARLSVKLKPGDLFLSIAGSVGKPCITQIKCCIHDGFVYFPRWKADPKFLYYLFASGEPYKGLGKMGTQLNLNTDTVGSIVIGLPDADEQQTIARFLDAKTAQIDGLIAKKRQLIDKLKEKRQALIARTVTRGLPPEAAKAAGLDPNPKMKESGVDWIGAVPSTWGIVPLKRRAHFVEGPGIMASDFIDEGVPLIRISGVQAKYASLNGANYLDPELVSQKWEHFKTKSGDLLISGSASTGLCSEVDEATEGCIPYTGIIIIRALKKSASNAFLRWYFQSNQFLSQVQIMKTGSTIQHFGPTHLSRMTIALPHKVMEQEAIAAFLDTTIAEFDSMAATVEAAIERLVEYRQAVIISSITGKIDVRELA